MHAAPPVRVALGRSWGWVAFVAACAGLAALQIAAWLGQGFEWPWASTATVALSSAATVGVVAGWLAWRAQQPGSLWFDGRRWQWCDWPGRLTLAIDLQAWMMLRFEPDTGMPGRQCWIAASRRSVGAAWPSLRAALYSFDVDADADAAVDPPPPVAPPG